VGDHPLQDGDQRSALHSDAAHWKPWAAGITAAVLAAPLLLVLFSIGALVVYFHAGGTIISDGPEPPHAIWEKPADILLGGLALGLDFWIGRRFYRRSLRNQEARLSAEPSPSS
jgi:hypothetical protein